MKIKSEMTIEDLSSIQAILKKYLIIRESTSQLANVLKRDHEVALNLTTEQIQAVLVKMFSIISTDLNNAKYLAMYQDFFKPNGEFYQVLIEPMNQFCMYNKPPEGVPLDMLKLSMELLNKIDQINNVNLTLKQNVATYIIENGLPYSRGSLTNSENNPTNSGNKTHKLFTT